jgi:hypothetical protein
MHTSPVRWSCLHSSWFFKFYFNSSYYVGSVLLEFAVLFPLHTAETPPRLVCWVLPRQWYTSYTPSLSNAILSPAVHDILFYIKLSQPSVCAFILISSAEAFSYSSKLFCFLLYVYFRYYFSLLHWKTYSPVQWYNFFFNVWLILKLYFLQF